MTTQWDRNTLKRVADAIGDVHLYDKHHTGEFIAMRLRDSLADSPGYDQAAVDDKLMQLARIALDAAEVIEAECLFKDRLRVGHLLNNKRTEHAAGCQAVARRIGGG